MAIIAPNGRQVPEASHPFLVGDVRQPRRAFAGNVRPADAKAQGIPANVFVNPAREPSPLFTRKRAFVPIRKDGDSLDNRVKIGVWTAFVAGITAFFLGAAYKNYDESNQAAKEARAQANDPNESLESKEKEAKITMAKLKEKIAIRNKDSAGWDISLRTTLLAGCIIGFVGALLISNPAVMLFGVVVSILAVTGMFFKMGNSTVKQENARDLAACKFLAESLNIK